VVHSVSEPSSSDATLAGLVCIAPGPAREPWIPLLELADEPEPLRVYLQEGDLYALSDPDGSPRAAILVIEDRPGVAELRAVAVAETAQGQGVGTVMIDAVLSLLAERGVRTAVVGTASSGVRQLGFYQRCGFRLSHVERDFFTAAKGYPAGLIENGIAIRDMVWMDRDLRGLLSV
jgi:ribosomal protein S18 acetylase RimI-like enzyme